MAAADDFERWYAAGLRPRATNADFEHVGSYLRTLSAYDLATACLQRYLAVYRQYESDANRSRGDVAFYLVLKRVLDLAKPAQLDAWADELTSAKPPRSLLGQRFDALGAADRRRLLQIAKLPWDTRKHVAASVLDELRAAFQAANGRPAATTAELLTFYEPLGRNDELRRAYNFALGLLRASYNASVTGQGTLPGADLASQCAVFWEFVRGQRRDGLRLFQLLGYWRQSRIGPDVRTARGRTASTIPSDEVEQIAYVQIAAALLSYALATKAYSANLRLASFTPDEWDYVLTPLRGRTYADTYESMLTAFPAHANTFEKQCELFLRLLVFARRKNMTLATNAELKKAIAHSAAQARIVLGQLQPRSGGDYRPPTVVVPRAPGRRDVATGTWSAGDEIAERFRIAFIDETPPTDIYAEFDGIPGALFKMPYSTFVGFTTDAVFDLVYKATAPLVYLIPILFQVLLSMEGVVDGGFIGLVRALLSPVELEAGSAVLDAFGLDPDQAGWWLLGATLLTHSISAAARGRAARGIQDTVVGERGTEAAKAELSAARQVAISDDVLAGEESAAAAADAAGQDATGSTVGVSVPDSPGTGAAARPVSRPLDPVIPAPRFPASENLLMRGTATPANKNWYASLADSISVENLGASEVAALEGRLGQLEGDLAHAEGAEVEQAVAASGGRGTSGGQPQVGSTSGVTTTSRSTSSRGFGRPGAGIPRSLPSSAPTVIDLAMARAKNLNTRTIQWLKFITANWRQQSAAFRAQPGMSVSRAGIEAHEATQEATKRAFRGTVSEELTGVSSSSRSRRSDLAEGPNVGAVVELKQWGAIMSDGRLVTAAREVASGIESIQLQAYRIVEEELERPVFIITANGTIFTPGPGRRWTVFGSAR